MLDFQTCTPTKVRKSNKKIFITLLLIFMVFSFIGCQNIEPAYDTSTSDASTNDASTNEEPSYEDSSENTNEGTDEDINDDTPDDTPANDDSPGSLSALHVQHIGRAPAVFRVVRALPYPGSPGGEWLRRSMVISSDYTPYSLMILFEPMHEAASMIIQEQEKPVTVFESSALLLFTLIDNLDKVIFALWYTPGSANDSGDDYDYAWTATRHEIAELFGVDNWGSLLANNNYVEDILAMPPVAASSS